MKKIFLLLVFIICGVSVQAQLQATLNVDANPTPEFNEWANQNNLAILMVTNPSQTFRPEYQIKVSLLLDGDLKLTTDESTPFMIAEVGTETFLIDELMPANAIQYIDTNFRDEVNSTGLLPPGTYSFCIELIGRKGRSLTQPSPICRPMVITEQQITALTQLQATLNIDTNPTPELSEWVNRNNLAILTVTNVSETFAPEYRVKVSLSLDGDLKLTTNESLPYMVSDLGTETFLADELIPYNAIQFIDTRFKNEVTRTGMLPPGTYSFCVELIDREGNRLTQPEEICRPMIITDYQMPELLSPVDGKIIDPILINSIMFQWTPLVPIPDAETGINYLIAVSEVQPGQTPSQAFTVNYPIIEEEVSVGTQFIWPIDIEAPEEKQQYVWGIKPMTNEGNTYRAQNNGFVDYGVFTINGTNKNNIDTTKNTSNDDIIINKSAQDNTNKSNSANCDMPNELFTNHLSASIVNDQLVIDGLDNALSAYCSYLGLAGNCHESVSSDWSNITDHSTTIGSWTEMLDLYDAQSGDKPKVPKDICFTVEVEIMVDGVPTTCEHSFCFKLDKAIRNQIEDIANDLYDEEVEQNNTSKDEENALYQEHVETLNCDNAAIDDLKDVFIYQAMYPSNPEIVHILALDQLRLLYLSQVTGSVDLSEYTVTSHIDWGDISGIDDDFITSTIADHNYLDYAIASNFSIPDEICIILEITDNTFPDLKCRITICKDIPQDQLDIITDKIQEQQTNFENGNDQDNTECACLDGSPVLIPEMTIEYTVNGAGDEHTLTIPDSAAELQTILDCMASQEIFTGAMNEDGHPEYNYQSGFFTGTVTHTWHIPDAMNDPSNTHMFTVLDDDDEPLPEFVTVTFHIVNTNASIDCYFTQDIPIPHEAYNAINGIDECECDDDALEEPELTLLRPDAIEEPKEILFGGIIDYRDYLLNCNSNYSLETHDMEVTLNWGGDFTEESIDNSGPFTHDYDAEDQEIPTEICVTFAITPLFPSSEGQACVTTKCLPVPEEWLALNTPAVGDGELAPGDIIFAGEHVGGNGEFEITTNTVTDEGDGSFSGTGTAHIPWLLANVAVEFSSITVDGDSNLVSGEISVVVSDEAPVYPYGCVGMGHDNAEDIQDWLTTDGEIVDYNPAMSFITPLEVPFGINFPSGDIIAVSKMVFKPTKSEFNVLAIKQFQPDVNPDQVLGFKACDIDFHPAAPVWPPERLELLEDITLGNVNNKITFTFKAPVPDANPGCFIEWGSTGITNYAVEIDVDFTREWLIPVDEVDGTEKSTANLVGAGTAWDGIVLTGNLEESILSATVPDPDDGAPTDTGAHDFIILADEIALDMADTLNTPGMTFPPIYTGETTNLFRGFYMDELTVKFSPNKMNTPDGDPVEVSINDMIIDDTGITLTAEVENLIAFGGAEVADMVASIDRVYLEILSSNFVEAGVEGRIAIPVNEGNGLDNSLAYTALFNNPLDPALNNNFQIVLEPDQPIQNDLFGGGEFTLDETSNLTGYFDKDKKTFTMDLNGDFAWEDATVGPVNQINMELGFEGLGFDYDSSLATNKLTFDQGNWSFASPQKKAANFPVTIEEIEFNQLPTTGNQLLHGKLNFDVIFNLSKKIGGRSTLGIVGAISDTKSSGGKTFDPELIGAVIDSISISADMAAVKINGAIGFRNNDPVYGNGFIGTIEAEFKAGGLKIGALAEFGNTTYNHTDPYRYWRVEADVTFPAPGITFLPGMAFRGFGGGAFRNMIATPSGSDFIFTPEYDQLGFRANAVIATTPKEETFNADVGLLAAFSGSEGMTNIAFTGDFFVGAKISDRSKAKIDGAVGVSYNFPNKKFILSAAVNVNAPPITTPSPVSLLLDIDGKKNEWFFKFGEPDNLNIVQISGITLYEYLMFGNKIPYPGGFTDTFTNNYYSAVGNYPYAGTTGTGGVDSNTETGKGFAMGIGFMFDKDGEYKITSFGNGDPKHELYWDLSAGAELHLSYMQYVGSCGGYTPLGINGYRAKGGLGMYGTAVAGVRRYKNTNHSAIKWNISLASIKAGAWIVGEFPKPSYAAGAVEGEVGLFDDLISFDFYQSFEYGTSCGNGGAGGGAPVTQGDAAAEQENALISYVKTSPSFEFPITQPLITKFGLAPDEVFDVSEQQANGTVEMRTFKMVKTASLQIKNETTGAWEGVSIDESQNNLGEYLYIEKTITEMAAAPTMELPASPGFGGLGVAAPATTYVSSPSLGVSGAAPSGVAPSGGALAGPSGLTSYPVSPSGDYDDLPPDPEPIINNLQDDRNYKFTVTATLKEYIGSSWSTAQKNDGSPVTQTIIKTFSTGPMEAIGAGPSTFSK